MRINKIECPIKFKRFNGFNMDLGEQPQKIIALVGPNGCGKSSIFDAILLSINTHNVKIGSKDQQRFRPNNYYNYYGVEDRSNYKNIKVFIDNKPLIYILNDLKTKSSILRYDGFCV